MLSKIICHSVILLCILVLWTPASLASDTTLSNGLSYEIRKNDKHVIHILTIDPIQYQLRLVKAHNQVFGRETVPAIALRTNAIAAINGGFFEIGNSEDGHPSGTLIINGNIFSLAKQKHAFMQLSEDVIHFAEGECNVNCKVNAQVLVPDKINRFVNNKEIVFYNHVWGPTSLTPFDRQEILVDKHFRVTNIVDHGDNTIPAQGWILSFPKLHVLPSVKVGQKIALDVNFNNNTDHNDSQWKGTENRVMGIPLLVKNGQVVSDLGSANQKDFVNLPHARTAVGIQPNGTVVMVVVEHEYTQPVGKVSLEQARNILRDKQYSKEKLATMPASEMCSVIQQELVSKSNIIGLPLPDLAKLMIDLKCLQAINLDGGGSSTLFLNGQVKNIAIGDNDEAIGQKKLRPVSDAIVVVKRN